MYKLIVVPLLYLGMVACGDGQQAKLEAETWTSVLEQHDVVMPLMSDINKIKKSLVTLLKNQEGLTANDSTKIQTMITNLTKADEGMMDWMNGFPQLEKLQAEKGHEEILSFLAKQQTSIEKVGKEMRNSIKEGKEFLEAKTTGK